MKSLIGFIRKRFTAILIALFGLTLVPMLAVSVYDFPMSDDYHYGYYVHEALRSGGSLWAALRAAGAMTAYAYVNWQGTYSAIFLMSLQPGAFADRAYALVPFILLGALVFATFRLLHTVLCGCMGEKPRYVVWVGVPMLFLCIQYLPSANQGFYWFNGASYYTLYYSFMLLYIDAFLRFLRSERKTRAALHFTVAALLAAVIGGGNFVTALLTLLAGFLFLAYCIFKKRGRLIPAAVLQVIFIAGFLTSVLAPGNAVRQAASARMGVPLTLIFSVLTAGQYVFFWCGVPVVIFILLIPTLYGLAGRSAFRFRYPGLFLLFTFLLFAAQNAPHFYAMSSAGPGRLLDIVYYGYIWFLLVNFFYFLGWIYRKHPEFAAAVRARMRRRGLQEGGTALPCWAAGLLLAATLNPLALWQSSTYLTAGSIFSGEAAAYGREMNARLALYEDAGVKDVLLPSLTAAPEALHFTEDITGFPKTYNNYTVARYYHKKSVAIDYGLTYAGEK